MKIRRASSTPLILTIVSLGVFVAALDQTVVVTALPSVMADIRIPVTQLDRASWIVTGYLLGYTVAMPLMGRISDVYGHPRLYQVSLVLFALGSLLVAVSSSLPWIVASRVIQAVGGGATVPIGMAIASSVLPPARRGLALGLIGAAAEAGSVLGPLYGGTIIQLLDWRWIFWLNLPLSALLVVALTRLPNSGGSGGRVDYLGGLTLAATLTVLAIAVSRREAFAVTSFAPYLLAALGLILVLALVWIERRVSQPLLASILVRSFSFITSNITQLLVGIALVIGLVTVPLMANTVMGRGPLEGGLWLMRLTGAIPLGAILGGYLLGRINLRYVERFGSRIITVSGLVLVALGFFLLSGWQTDIGEPWLTLHLVVGGLGFGLVIAPIIYTAMSAAPEEYHGTAVSLVTVARMVGMTLGLAALSAWGMEHFQGLTRGLDELELFSEEYLSQLTQAGMALFRDFFRVAGIIALVAIVPALGMWPRSLARVG